MTNPNNAARVTSNRRAPGRPVGVIAKGIRVKAWRAMRALSTDPNKSPFFTLGDLLDIVATGAEKDPYSNLCKYLAFLERHGIVSRLETRQPGAALYSNGQIIWKIEKDLGWYAPVWRVRKGVLYDPNAKALVARVDQVEVAQ